MSKIINYLSCCAADLPNKNEFDLLMTNDEKKRTNRTSKRKTSEAYSSMKQAKSHIGKGPRYASPK